MQAIFDFITAALPWMAMGLMVAVSLVRMQGKRLPGMLLWLPGALFLLAAILPTSGRTTWLVLGLLSMGLCNYQNVKKES